MLLLELLMTSRSHEANAQPSQLCGCLGQIHATFIQLFSPQEPVLAADQVFKNMETLDTIPRLVMSTRWALHELA